MSWFPVKRLLVPVDFSEMSLQAVEVGLSLVDDAAHLHIIYVAPEVVTGDPGFGWKPLEALTRKGQIAKALQETLCESRHQGIKVDVAFGDQFRPFERGLSAVNGRTFFRNFAVIIGETTVNVLGRSENKNRIFLHFAQDVDRAFDVRQKNALCRFG